MGQTMAGYRVFETLRCIDYLLTRNDVEAAALVEATCSGEKIEVKI
ncbi:hypothetical protein [Cohnella nanjingensis]|nr:hypothetical protein [Cohnella nanjingensis]